MSEIIDEDYLIHYGTPRKSGRYPWGTGGNVPHQQTTTRNQDFLGYVADLERQGLSEKEVARGMGTSIAEIRARKSIEVNRARQDEINTIVRLREKGVGQSEISRQLGIPEPTVRLRLKQAEQRKENIIETTAEKLKERVDQVEFLDVGSGTEGYLGVSATRLNTALFHLKAQGYEVHDASLPQVSVNQRTEYRILTKPGNSRTDVFNNRDKIQQMVDYSEDGGETYKGRLQPPLSVGLDRIAVRYREDGGNLSDGVIYIREGVEDISLGGSRYAQVRVQVGDTHYMKGMAVYKPDMPEGVDILLNSAKSDTGNPLDAMKKLEPVQHQPNNPFGSNIRRQITGADGKLTSAMNIVNEDATWEKWSDSVASQMLSKQRPSLIKNQLDMTYERRQKEFEEISSLTNPTVRKKLLETFGDETDSSAVHLEAAGFKKQAWKVILPIEDINPTHVYAPTFRDGERVVLIRYPHGGTFEIPELIVNNSHKNAKKTLGDAEFAIGIHPKVAERLSGADFDGDTVLVIPDSQRRISIRPALDGLKDFDSKLSYPPYHGMKTMDGGTWDENLKKSVFPEGKSPSSRAKGIEMGKVSNLITDMTLGGAAANGADLAAAVRHSMVVIDAEKHYLDYRQSERDNRISQLKEKYQGKKNAGASTLISRARAEEHIPERKARPAAQGGAIDKETGRREFVPTGRMQRNRKTGDLEPAMITVDRLSVRDDARSLLSGGGVGTVVERLYADHSNKLKDLANKARLEAVHTPNLKVNPSAKRTYATERESLLAKLRIAERNRPLERQAQVIAGAKIHAIRTANPGMDPETVKKIKNQALTEARIRTGATNPQFEITPSEWNAIQAGAISHHQLDQILDKANLETVRKLATPKTRRLMTPTRIALAQKLLASGATQAQVAEQLGVSLTTLKSSLNG